MNFARAQIKLPAGKLSERVVVAADVASHWKEGAYDVYLLRGNCYINQGLTYARSREAVVWIQQGGPGGEPPHKAIVYLEGDVTINYQQAAAQGKAAGAATLTDRWWFGRFFSLQPIDVRPSKTAPPPPARPTVYEHASAAMGAPSDHVQPAQFAEPIPSPPPVVGPPPGTIRIRMHGRSNVKPDLDAYPVPNTNELVAIVKSGVNIVVDGLENFGSIDVDTDNLVIWTQGSLTGGLEGESFQSRDAPLELYMEGNVVFRQGERTIYAQRMYYDVRRETGIVLGAEVLTPVESYQGLLKLRADVVQMAGRDHFIAQNASLTTSRMGIPTYELRAGLMTYDDVQQPRFNVLGQPLTDPSGAPIIDHQKLATSRNNRIYIEQVPVFYWPFMATDLETPNFYIDDVQIKNDNVFGVQAYLDWNAYQIFGIRNPPQGTKWEISTDYFSDRGPGGGTTFDYERQTFFGVPESTNGFFDIWTIYDHGHDNLGVGRRDLIPPRKFRGRLLGQHRQLLPGDFQLTGEVGLISDFNFLEQYFEREWDQLKDQTTDLELKQFIDNSSWSILGAVRLNPYFTETQWLPRLDHFWIGQALLGDRLTYYEHSSIGFAQFKSAEPPTDPIDAAIWGPLRWEAPASSTRTGGRYATRHEIDYPFSLGALKVDPYALGELARWDTALNFSPANRAYGALGMRASLPFWTVDPLVEDDLFNVHGLAHKVVLETDVSYAQSTLPLQDLSLYDPVDDNNIEEYRRKLSFYDFGGPPSIVPLRFDERFYALRRGLGNWVASQSTEIADDLFVVRLGARQRWQTKRGPIGRQHIVDWILLRTDVTLYPDPNRDNFGTVAGLLDHDFRWHVGDRTTIVSQGYFDFFGQAPKYATAGVFVDRPPRGSIYFGFHSLEGPIASNVFLTTYSYRMSPKWTSTFGMSYDFVAKRNIGQNFTLTRIGESFLLSLNMNVDTSKNNIGVNMMVTPRFFQGRLGALSPSNFVPVAGVYGIE